MKRIIFIAVIILLAAQGIIFHNFWLTRMGEFLIYQDKIEPADAILVLGGGKRERVEQGIELFKKNYAGWIIFTGDYEDFVYEKPTHWALEARKLAVASGVPQEKIIPVLNSDSTRDDAALAKEICLYKHFRSLIVVSEPYHTKRSHFIFNKIYKGAGIKIMIYPVQDSWYKPDSWWKSKDGFWNTNIEYQKMLYYLFKGYLI